MKMMKATLERIAWLPLLAAVLFNINTPSARAQGTAFTYQGSLSVNGSPANGSYDVKFSLFDAATNGTAFGAQTNSATPVTNGLFTVTLNFGGVFSGANYWLEIAARTNGAAAFAILNPLQPITPTPYAIYSANAGTAAIATTAVTAGTAAIANFVAGANITGTLPLAQLPAAVLTNNEAGASLSGTFYGAFNGNGAGLTNVNSLALVGTALAGGIFPMSSRLGFVATRGRYNGYNNTSSTWCSSMSYHIARDWITSPKVFFQNFGYEETGNGYPATFSAAIMYPTNVITQLTFSGHPSGTAPINGMVATDGTNLLKVPIPPGAGFWLRDFYTNTGGVWFSTTSGATAQPQDTFAWGTNAGVDNTTNGGSMGVINSGNVCLPLAIVDKTSNPSPLIIGDSRCYGLGENLIDGSLQNGYGRFFEPNYGLCNLGMPGASLLGFASYHTNRLFFTNFATVAIFELGINSYNGLTFASFWNQYTNSVSYLNALPVIGATMEPETTSSDHWATFGNQVNSVGPSDANRISMNTLLRNGQVPWVSRHMDPAAAVEGQTGKWIVNGTANGYTGDGIHGNTQALLVQKYSLGDPLVDQSSLSVNGGQINSPLTINGLLTVSGPVSGATFTGNGAGLTNVPASAITGGFNTNLLMAGHTFYITNGLIMKVQ